MLYDNATVPDHSMCARNSDDYIDLELENHSKFVFHDDLYVTERILVMMNPNLTSLYKMHF